MQTPNRRSFLGRAFAALGSFFGLTVAAAAAERPDLAAALLARRRAQLEASQRAAQRAADIERQRRLWRDILVYGNAFEVKFRPDGEWKQVRSLSMSAITTRYGSRNGSKDIVSSYAIMAGEVEGCVDPIAFQFVAGHDGDLFLLDPRNVKHYTTTSGCVWAAPPVGCKSESAREASCLNRILYATDASFCKAVDDQVEWHLQNSNLEDWNRNPATKPASAAS